MSREINRYYDSLSDKDWQRVFSARRERPLKILLTTSKFSTFVQYCTRDVAQGFEALGHQTRTIIEKAYTERFSFLNFSRNLASFKPDMVFTINHLRREYDGGLLVHKSIPFVCWVQDELPTLYNQQAAKTIGKRDIVLGVRWHIRRLVAVGYPNENLSCIPYPTNEQFYHPMNLGKKDRGKHDCEVSYVSHVSFSPEKVFADLLAQINDYSRTKDAKGVNDYKEILKIMFELVKERFYDEKDCYNQSDYEPLLLEAEEQKGSRIEDDRLRAYILKEFFYKIGSAFFRQLPLEWIAEEGYDLKLYGKGWENHPRLSKHAQGPAINGQELCKVYNSSQINLHLLHVSILHPRLIDGLASGGFFLVKYHADGYAQREMANYFDTEKDIILFRGKDDLLKKIKFYLEHPGERKLITERARKKVLEKLTYPVSMQFVIDKVREQIEGSKRSSNS